MKKGHDIVATEKINIYKQKVVLGDFLFRLANFLIQRQAQILFFFNQQTLIKCSLGSYFRSPSLLQLVSTLYLQNIFVSFSFF